MASRSYNWECVVWKQSLESQDLIYDFRVKGYLSPLHDKDGGDPHYHWIMCFDSLKSYDQVMQMIEEGGLSECVNTVRYVRDLTSSARYLCHLDEKKKFHYDPVYVECLGGVSYSKFLEFETDKALDDMSIIGIIRKYRIRSYAQLVDYCIYVKREHYRSVSGRCGFWSAYIRSIGDSRSYELDNIINEKVGLSDENSEG